MSTNGAQARIAVLAGGLSLERDVSLQSGRRVAEALTERGYDVTRLDLDASLVSRLTEDDFDAAYLALHGTAGEDGTVQGLLELLGVRYTGPDSVASALSWDKAVAKGLLRRRGLPTPDWATISASAIRDLGAAPALGRMGDAVGLPVVVKPAEGGGSMGVAFVERAEDLPTALVGALSYHEVAVVETQVSGAEIAVSIVDGEVLPPVEIVPAHGAYDYSARYTAGATAFFAPARLDDDVLERCSEVALAAWDAVGARHVTRVDLIVDGEGTPWLLELDTCPGMTGTSLLPIAAEAHGWSFPELCDRIIRCALRDGVPASGRSRPAAARHPGSTSPAAG